MKCAHWVIWHINRGKRYRWVETDDQLEFGQVWYNYTSDLLFIRRVTHEFDHITAQCIEDQRVVSGCVLIGDL